MSNKKLIYFFIVSKFEINHITNEMSTLKIYKFIANGLNMEEEVNPMYFDKTIKELGFNDRDAFLDFNKKFVESLNETSIDFYLDLIKKIRSKKIELRNVVNPTHWGVAGWFYFNANGKLVLLPGHENKETIIKDNFYAKLNLLCAKDQVRLSTDYFGTELELSEYKYNQQTNRFTIAHVDAFK